MMQLKLVKTAAEELTHLVVSDADACLNHATVIINSLVYPWIMSDLIVCADSYSASVGAAEKLNRLRLFTVYWCREDGDGANPLLRFYLDWSCEIVGTG
jgi:hypothetical protein